MARIAQGCVRSPLWHWVLIVVTFLAFALPGEAGTIEEIRSRGVLRVGMSGDYQPFSLCTADFTACHGFDVEVARRVAADLGVQLSLIQFRWPDLRTNLTEEKFDIAMSGVTVRPERVLAATFTQPYALSGAVVLVADATTLSTLTAVDRPQVRLAVNAGGHLEQVARTYFPAATILPTAKNLSLPAMVNQQQADALLTDSLEASHFLAAAPTLHALPPFGVDRKAYLLRRHDVAVREWLDRWLQERETDGWLPTLRVRWFGKNTTVTPHHLALLLTLLDVRLALMPAIADYKRRHDLPIEDVQQEKAVLERVAMQARAHGGKVAALQQFFQVQIELAKKVQLAVVQEQPPKSSVSTWGQTLDLKSHLRPALQELGDRIILEADRQRSMLRERGFVEGAVEREITSPYLSAQDKRQLAEALWRISQDK